MATENFPAPTVVVTGNYPIAAQRFTAKAATAIAQYQVLQFTASATTVEPWDGTDNAKLLIAMHAVASAAADRNVQCYTSGEFNAAALVFPGAITTIDAKRKAFVGTAISLSILV